MKKLGLVALGLLFSACAGKGTHTNTETPTRNPAGDSKLEYTIDRKEISLCGNSAGMAGGTAANYQGEVQLVSKQTRVYTETVIVRNYGQCETTVIDDGNGKGDWKGFYGEIPGRAGGKASQLADAIKGIGPVISEALLPYFAGQPKPKSWKQFADRINYAAQDLKRRKGMSEGWKHSVLGRYKDDNIVNLGYVSGSITLCPYTESTEVVETGRDELGDLRVLVRMRVRGGKLLPNECEKHVISFDGRRISGGSESDYNVYRDRSGSNVPMLEFQGVLNGVDAVATYQGSRAQVTPDNYIDNRTSNVAVNGGSAQIHVSHPDLAKLNAIPEFAQACKLSITATVTGETGSGWNSKKEALKTVTFALDNDNSTTKEISGVDLRTDKKGRTQTAAVDYTTAFAPGCPFFNTRPSAQSVF